MAAFFSGPRMLGDVPAMNCYSVAILSPYIYVLSGRFVSMPSSVGYWPMCPGKLFSASYWESVGGLSRWWRVGWSNFRPVIVSYLPMLFYYFELSLVTKMLPRSISELNDESCGFTTAVLPDWCVYYDLSSALFDSLYAAELGQPGD
jgi:hypothetical protein